MQTMSSNEKCEQDVYTQAVTACAICVCPPPFVDTGKLTSPLFNLCFKNANQRNNKNGANKWKRAFCIRSVQRSMLMRECMKYTILSCDIGFSPYFRILFMLAIKFSVQFRKQKGQYCSLYTENRMFSFHSDSFAFFFLCAHEYEDSNNKLNYNERAV